ncbi:hypothetical protein OG552_30835 [Streptomyces sp. NBC_01476]|nr:hypothetical protein [Streptomyces sp. NBC_01476]
MDAIVLLRDDHKTVEQLLKEFEKAADTAARPDAPRDPLKVPSART